MDPDANLAEQLRLAARMRERAEKDCDEEGLSHDEVEAQMDDAERLAELVEALHGWMSRGGAIPKAWTYKPT